MLNKLPVDERRAQLVECALDLAERGGISAVTVRAVAAHAGVSLGMVHYCFEGKDELLAAMAERLVLELSASARQVFAAVREAPEVSGVRGLRELLQSGVDGMWSTMEANPNRRLLTYEITTHALRFRAAGSPPTGAVADEQYAVMDAEVSAFLDECAERTETTWTEPVAVIAHRSLAALDGLVLRWLVDRNTEAIRAELDEVVLAITSKAVEKPPGRPVPRAS
ncbi:TetR/AcrR family transcriptional regulator [Rhodococcus daqingensis]|uniref:TetR/AcrR family transcriptional regulator n=1 Tax=Rhodococcus daqingensis TaxID=2479363 RepID=A0ABW2S3W2_9NOCA